MVITSHQHSTAWQSSFELEQKKKVFFRQLSAQQLEQTTDNMGIKEVDIPVYGKCVIPLILFC